MTAAITRHFVAAGGRQVHYRRAGSGPPVVLLHESPRSSAALTPLIKRLAERFHVFAMDTPGYGGSAPLAARRPDIAAYADALAESLAALGLARVPVYGRHTGAAIALELSRRHPEITTVAVLDGYPLFTPAEMEEFEASYLPPFRPEWSGAHVAWLWARVRDQFTFFPWHHQGPAARLPFGPPRLATLAQVVADFLIAGDGYRVAYSAAFRYDAAHAAAQLRAPSFFVATVDDVLVPHLERLPALPDDCGVRRLSGDRDGWAEAIAEIFADHVGQTDTPAPANEGEGARFVQIDELSILVRQGSTAPGRPLVLFHASPGSSRQLAPLMGILGAERPVVVLDLPGHGFSSPLAEDGPGLDAFAGLAADVLTRLGVNEFDLAGVHAGAAVSAALAGMRAEPVKTLALIDPPLDEQALAQHYVVDLAPRWDGGHLMAAWHMLRDQLIYKPWFARGVATSRRLSVGVDVEALQERFTDMMQGGPAYAPLCAAAFATPLAARLQGLTCPLSLIAEAGDPDVAAQEALARESPSARFYVVEGVEQTAAALDDAASA
jgi:pimeloyl-ACP methyl ester carboxylesterase